MADFNKTKKMFIGGFLYSNFSEKIFLILVRWNKHHNVANQISR